MRQVMDATDLSTNQKIYFKGHAKATYMSDGRSVEDVISVMPTIFVPAYTEVLHGTNDTTFTLTPNVFHVWDVVSALTLTLGEEESGYANEFLFQFTSGSTPTTLTLPANLKWANDNVPTIAENKTYQISILRGLASALEFSNN